MCDEGSALQVQLEVHFDGLHKVRGSGRAVFALEHGLTTDQLAHLRKLVAQGARSDTERSKHPLLWVVHAAEVAYDYEGDEYWQSFATATPGWDDRLRPWVRDTFRQFAGRFGGPEPTGRWARAFSLIAWPITNAVLPTDLQRHLARALAQASPGLRKRFDDIGELGAYIATAGGEGSDRYNQLREQPRLLGQIALALLNPEQHPDEYLLEATLRRLVADLEQERATRGWLHRARTAVEQTRVVPYGQRPTPGRPRAAVVEEEVQLAAKTTTPRVVLKPDQSVKGSWAVWLQLPNLSPIAAVDASVRDAFLSSRCWAPASDEPIARGQLLRAEQELKLARWPSPGTPLIRFQGLAAGLESSLLVSWAAPPLPGLFGVGGDGRAVYIESRAIRPGRRYVVVRDERLPGWESFSQSATCSGTVLYGLSIPNPVPDLLAKRLPELGLKLTRTSRIWPVGVVPVEWDNEAAGQWLADDAPVLGISPDHDLRALSVDLRVHGREAGLTAKKLDVGGGATVFLALPRLPVGAHRMIIREEPTQGPAAVREISLSIREPRVYSPSDSGPIRMWVEPHSRDLADLWDGVSAVCIGGVPGTVILSIGLADRPRTTPDTVFKADVAVPLGTGTWRSLMARLTASEDAARRYDGARWGVVEVDAGRFGSCSVEFERAIPALRWRVRGEDSDEVALIDDTGSGLDATTAVSTFKQPDRATAFEASGGCGAAIAREGGGLCVARLGTNVAAVIVPPKFRAKSFAELQVQPDVAPLRDAPSAIAALESMSLWSQTPLPGSPLARVWRGHVVACMHRQLIAWICGPRWKAAEDHFFDRRSEAAWLGLRTELSSTSPLTLSCARELVDSAAKMSEWPIERRIEAVTKLVGSAGLCAGPAWRVIATRRGTRAPEWTAELWLRLATDPGCHDWLGGLDREALEFASQWSLPVRVARCLALRTIVGPTEMPDFPPLFSGWGWR